MIRRSWMNKTWSTACLALSTSKACRTSWSESSGDLRRSCIAPQRLAKSPQDRVHSPQDIHTSVARATSCMIHTRVNQGRRSNAHQASQEGSSEGGNSNFKRISKDEFPRFGPMESHACLKSLHSFSIVRLSPSLEPRSMKTNTALAYISPIIST